MSVISSTAGNVTSLRLVREDDPANELAVPEGDIESLQHEVASLRDEISHLRRRSEKLNFHLSRIDEELKLAARLQQDFLPKTLPQVGQMHFHTLFRPVGHVSGDFYDVLRLDETHVGFYIADAVGHGVPAALLTMFIKHALATKQIGVGGYRLLTAAETMSRLNETLIEQALSAATFATALYGTVDIKTNRVTFSRAGHPLPILLRANGAMETPDCEGGLLGVFPEERYSEQTIQLNVGDRLLLVTDGVEVAFSDDIANSQLRWSEELEARRQLPAEEFLDSFGKLIDKCSAESPLRDDVTMLMLEVKPKVSVAK
jgi:sigma-B regulation protein RsbU (phosphoserine phosphatase)